ncbi:YCII-like protein [Lineolata rhizophorae]|uniref:YCII-like protein n=1 Tax=Lineolata rhizophorae TaxID=578093 RepID=A0A6A6NPX2_9PEZI|nr:YCII-like protein [Lineolata rhizophorae]
MPRFMFIIKSNHDAEGGAMPPQEALEAMTAYNSSLSAAGILLAGEGLHPTKEGARVTFTDDVDARPPTVTKGPFTSDPVHTLVAGFWLVRCKDLDEALSWVKKCPLKLEGAQIEVRRIHEAEDFGHEFTPELRAEEERIRKEVEGRK